MTGSLADSAAASPNLARLTELADSASALAWTLGLAAAVLLAGSLLAAATGWLLRVVLRSLRFNAAARRIVGTRLLGAHEPAVLASWALRWFVAFVSAVVALDVLGFDLSGALAARLHDLLPRVILAAALFVTGSSVAILLGGITRRFFESAGLGGAVLRGRIVSGVLTFLTVLLAIEQLGFASQFVMALGLVVAGSAGLALALAFGLGSRELARDFLVEFMKSLDEGSERRP